MNEVPYPIWIQTESELVNRVKRLEEEVEYLMKEIKSLRCEKCKGIE